MIEIRKLSITKISEKRDLINDLTFLLNPSDKYALIGLEGIGKSTLLKVILGKEDLDYIEVKGEIQKNNNTIGYLPQSIGSKWNDQTSIDFLLKENPNDIVNPEDYQKLAILDKILNDVRFDIDKFDDSKKISQYSGGEIIKLGLTKILLDEPDVLLLDEPTNDLDLETIIFLEDFILREERPIIFISHDETLLENTATGVIHLTQIHGKTIARSYFQKGSYTEYVTSRKLSMETQEMIAKKQRSNLKKKMDKLREVYQKVERLQDDAVRSPTKGRLLKKKIHALKSQKARYEKEEKDFVEIPEREEEINLFFSDIIPVHNSKVVLDYNNEKLTIEGKILARNVKLFVKGPKKIAIIGKNGSGKTTLLKEIYQSMKTVENIKVGYMSQNYDDVLDPNGTALDALLKDTEKDKETINKVRTMMGSISFTGEEMLYKQNSLSGGQKAKLLLLKMVIDKDNVLLLDEPTRNLSPLSIPVIHNLLLNFEGSIISVTHDRRFIENVFDEVYILSENGLEKL
ncbi:MAG: ABC-F family ATP-binding cassette domain-containing protein [Tenericutes bacterium]|nr:ABC-F family ATP-binding cassette domain-containing protein [Mycoplasmatota bacterium]